MERQKFHGTRRRSRFRVSEVPHCVRVNHGDFDVPCAIEELKRFSASLKTRRVKKKCSFDKGLSEESLRFKRAAYRRLNQLYTEPKSADTESMLQSRLVHYMTDPDRALAEMLTDFRVRYGRMPEPVTTRRNPEDRPGLLVDISKDLNEKLTLICGRRLSNQRRTYPTSLESSSNT